MGMKIQKFTAHEKKELVDSLKRANSTIAKLVKSFLVLIEETEEEPARRERLKTNFLFAVSGVFDGPRISAGLVKELEMIAADLREEKILWRQTSKLWQWLFRGDSGRNNVSRVVRG
jgi:hypothetical protein